MVRDYTSERDGPVDGKKDADASKEGVELGSHSSESSSDSFT